MLLVIGKIVKALVTKAIVSFPTILAKFLLVFKSTTFKVLALFVALQELIADRLLSLTSSFARRLAVRFVRDDPEVQTASQEMVHRLEQALWLDYAIAWCVLVICFIALVMFIAFPLIYKLLVRRRLRIFISYNRAREYIAAELQRYLESAGLRVCRIPFRDEATHQDIVRQAIDGIRGCDSFICLPGDTQSYVDCEVLAASTVGKPVTFLVPSTGTLPNTADKRYPMFRLEVTREEQFKPLIDFVRYVGGDLKSTLALLKRAARQPLMHAFTKAALVLMGICIVSLWLYCFYNVRVSYNLVKELASFAEVESAVVIAHSTILSALLSLAFCSVSYEFLFLMSLVQQFRARRQVGLKTIAGRFNHNDWIGVIPNLVLGEYDCFFDKALLAHHESKTAVADFSATASPIKFYSGAISTSLPTAILAADPPRLPRITIQASR